MLPVLMWTVSCEGCCLDRAPESNCWTLDPWLSDGRLLNFQPVQILFKHSIIPFDKLEKINCWAWVEREDRISSQMLWPQGWDCPVDGDQKVRCGEIRFLCEQTLSNNGMPRYDVWGLSPGAPDRIIVENFSHYCLHCLLPVKLARKKSSSFFSSYTVQVCNPNTNTREWQLFLLVPNCMN